MVSKTGFFILFNLHFLFTFNTPLTHSIHIYILFYNFSQKQIILYKFPFFTYFIIYEIIKHILLIIIKQNQRPCLVKCHCLYINSSICITLVNCINDGFALRYMKETLHGRRMRSIALLPYVLV